MRFKYYLRGVGIGIIFTAIVLFIVFLTQKPSISDEEVIERAKALGMVMADEQNKNEEVTAKGEQETEGDPTVVDTEADAMNEETATSGDETVTSDEENATQGDETVTSDEENATQGEATVTSDEETVTSGEETTTPEISHEEGELVTVEIVRGEVCRTLAADLAAEGLIVDEEAFMKFMDRKGYDNIILPGSYQIPFGADFEEIGKILTTKK